MKTNQSNVAKVVRILTASALIAGFVLMPGTSSAGLRDKVTELKNKVQLKAEDVKEKIGELDSEGLEQLMETVGSMLKYVKQGQADYKNFVGADKCGAHSPCGAFRSELRKLIESFIKLPQELPFIENVPPAVRQLEKLAKSVDIMPPPLLYASEKVLGNVFEELKYRLDVVRYAAAQVPRFPTMAELSHASANSPVRSASANQSFRSSAKDKNGKPAESNPTTEPVSEPDPSFPYCAALLDTGKPHVELLAKTIEHVGDFLWDLADMMEENKTVVVNAVAGGGTSVKNPVKGTTQLVGFVIKSIRQVVEIKVAATASICALRGYKVP